MANYGAEEYGGGSDYTGGSTYTPADTELAGAIYHFIGRDGWRVGEHRSVYTPQSEQQFMAWTEIVGGGAAVIGALAADVTTGPLGLVATTGAGIAGGMAVYHGIQTLTGGSQEIVPAGDASYTRTEWVDRQAAQRTQMEMLTYGVPIASGGGDAAATAVWAQMMYPNTGYDDQRGMTIVAGFEIMTQLLLYLTKSQPMPLGGVPEFSFVGAGVGNTMTRNWPWFGWEATAGAPVPIVWADVQEADTILSLLQRQQPSFGWWWMLGGGSAWQDYAVCAAPGGIGYYVCNLTTQDIHNPTGGGGTVTVDLKASGMSLPFPGLAGVDLGTPVSVTSSGLYDFVGDGALVTITHLPPGQGKQVAGTTTRYPYVGWLAFVSADGNIDEMQRIDIDNACYTPHNITGASKITVYAKPGLELTLTPWTLK